jgi:transcriptional regulator with XRE-family HTH domain
MDAALYKQQIGARLIQAREAIGLRQAEMARGLDIGRDKLNGYERGRFFPDPVVVYRMWRLYGVTADWIYLGVLAGLPHSVAARLDAAARASVEA